MAEEWDRFVSRSLQPSFLLLRGYMDYHSHRFADYSLIARRGGRILAMLPADGFLTRVAISGSGTPSSANVMGRPTAPSPTTASAAPAGEKTGPHMR